MLKIGFSIKNGITSAEPNTQETTVQQQPEQQTVVQPKSTLVNSAPMRSEAMMSSIALRTHLNQQLEAQPFRDNHDVVSSESLQHPEQIDRQPPLTQQEAEQQISNHPIYLDPFSPNEINEVPGYSALPPEELEKKREEDSIRKQSEEFLKKKEEEITRKQEELKQETGRTRGEEEQEDFIGSQVKVSVANHDE